MTEAELFNLFKGHRLQTHERLFQVADGLTQEQFGWQPAPTLPPIAFHMWHLARWADFDREALGGGEQIWRAEGLAARWGLNSRSLGAGETGMGMGDEMVPALAEVPVAQVLDYARRAIAAWDAHVSTLGPDDLERVTTGATGDRRDVALVLLGHFSHDNRHLGMIEALRGMQGLRGTATD